jgi:hypothetical protein
MHALAYSIRQQHYPLVRAAGRTTIPFGDCVDGGCSLGESDGTLLGSSLGTNDGSSLGAKDFDGSMLEGSLLGMIDGSFDGLELGCNDVDGSSEGDSEGARERDGVSLGC